MKKLRSIHWAALFSLALACTTEPTSSQEVAKQPKVEPEPEKSPEPEKPPEPVNDPVDGFFMAEGAPQPRACASKADCLGDTIPDLENPCCQNPHTLEPYSRAYREWLSTWRKDRCASVECPPPPPPAQPPACHFELDCVQGQCVDACKTTANLPQ
jgi:hypothetical protein